MRANDQQGTGYSLWLMPEPAERARLEALIVRWASRLGTVAFAPHVTLLGSLQGREEELLAWTRELARSTAPLSLRLTRTGGQDAFFRCFYVEVEGGAALGAAHARAAARFGVPARAAFFPHLSFVYGELSSEQKGLLAAEAGPEVEARTVAFLELRLVRTEGRVADWRRVGEVPLTG